MQQAGILNTCPQVYPFGQRIYSGYNLLPGRIASITCGRGVIGLNEIENEITDFAILPNPTLDKINIEFYSEKKYSGLISVYDILGKNLMEIKCKIEEGKNSLTLNVNEMVSGIYLIEVSSKSGKVYSKFLKQE